MFFAVNTSFPYLTYQIPHMETNYQTNDVLHNQIPERIPGVLNVITILTMIWCVLSAFIITYQSLTLKPYAEMHAQLEEQRDKVSGGGFAAKALDTAIEAIERNPSMIDKAYQYRYMTLGINLIAIVLCFIGALRMRRLRRSGYPLYVIGELLPIVASLVLLGLNASGWQAWSGLFFPILFIILYTTQRKYLIHD
jgi:hypothetical protein